MAFDREKVLRAAQTYVQRRRYDRAIPEYQKIVQHDPKDVRTLLRIGDLQSRLENYPEAVATYERVARQYAEQGFSLKAIAVYKQIREIIDKHVPFLGDRYSHISPTLAELYTKLGLISDALAAYDEVAIRLQKGGRDRDAIDVFRKIVGLDRNNPLHHLRLAEALSRLRDVDGAIQSFATATQILIHLGRQDDALKVLERLLHHRPEPRFARQAAEMYLARARGNDGMLALAKLQICFQANPKDLDTLGLLARAFVVIGQPAKALEVEKEMARLAHEQGKFDIFERIVAKLEQSAPGDPLVQRFVAQLANVTAAQARTAPQAAPPPPPARRAPERVAADEIIELSDDEVFLEEPELEVVEAATAPSARDLSQQTNAAIADAEWFRSQGLLSRAADTLKQAVQRQPGSVALHEALYNVLLEMGSHDEAAEVMLALALLALDDLDAEGAIGYLLAVLQIAPEHPRAYELLAELGYDLPAETHPTPVAPPLPHSSQPEAASLEHSQAEPLPAYELEYDLDDDILDAEDVVDLEEVAELEPVEASPAPLPSFPIEDGLDDEELAPAVEESAASLGSEAIEAALEEAEFFASRELFEDARAVLEEQLGRFPEHPLLIERLQEVDAALAAQQMGGSGPRERPLQLGEPSDIAIELDLLEIIPEPSPEADMAGEQVDVEEVFAKFKEGVRAQIDESDSATHYDLGVAYQEMGLYSDAIEELEIAARDPARACVGHSMAGAIYRMQGELQSAVASYGKALAAEEKTVEQELGILYEIADVYEAMQNVDEAIAWFDKLARKAPSYDDPRGSVQDRLSALRPETDAPSFARAVNDLDDFDAVFDSIVKSD